MEPTRSFDHEKAEIHAIEDARSGNSSFHPQPAMDAHGDRVAQLVGDERVELSDEDNKRIKRKTDWNILSILCWVYFLQVLDKSVLGYSSVFGLSQDAHLHGNQYSVIGSMGYYAQLGIQPLSALVLVKIPPKQLMPVIVFCWGVALIGMAFSKNFAGLAASRFLLGLFEAACLPLFSLMTVAWYRRAEQPTRVAAWYSTNGFATIIGSALSYGLGHIKSGTLHSYQIIFLVTGLMTVVTSPFLFWRLDNTVAEARFLSQQDRVKGVERLRANNTGVSNSEFKFKHVIEMLLEPKTYLWLPMTLLLNVGASVSNVFGPLILQGIAGFTAYETTLLNMPFGALQFILIWISSLCAYRYSVKGITFAIFMVPVVIGAALLAALPHDEAHKGPLLLGYYLLAFIFTGNPLIVSWIAGNTAGQTKKSATMSLYNAASSAGNIIGPFLFNAKDKPGYAPGLRAVLGIFSALIVVIGLQMVNLVFLNKMKANQRVRNGKPADIKDLSMSKSVGAGENVDNKLGANAFMDMTDQENDEFVYLL